MKSLPGLMQKNLSPFAAALALSLVAAGSYAGVAAASEYKLTLSGEQEVPPVQGPGAGKGTITINDDMSVSGRIMTTGIVGTKAHIHVAAAGANGPVVIELTKDGDVWSVPAGAKLTAEQYASFKSGDLYVNVHTESHPKGEMRAQIKP